jgi:hypothetical protein
MDGLTNCSFIAEDKLLVSGGVDGVIEIYSITDNLEPPQCTARLSLPSLMEDWIYQDVTMSISPRPGSVSLGFQNSSHRPSCFLHPNLDDQLILFDITLSDNSSFSDGRGLFFFIRQGAILLSLVIVGAAEYDMVPWRL